MNSDFNKLWIAQGVSAFGSSITREGLAYVAILTLAATPTDLSLLTLARAVPVLALGLVVGVWVDRVRRRPLLILADLARAAALAAIPVAAILGRLDLWLLYAVAAITATFTLIFDVADRSYLPSIVPRALLLQANSRFSLTGSLSEVSGPAIVGLLVQVISAPFVLALDVLSFIWSALWISLIRTPEKREGGEEGEKDVERPGFKRELAEGLGTLARHPILRTLAGVALLQSFFGWFFGTLYVYYALNELQLPSGVVGVLISTGGIGSLIGAATASKVSRKLGLGRMLVVAAFIAGGVNILVPLAGGPFALVVTFMFLSQFVGDIAWESYIIGDMSLRQMSVAQRLLGRVTSAIQFMTGGAGPLGALVAGALASATSARFALLVAVLGFIVGAVWLAFSPVSRVSQAPEA